MPEVQNDPELLLFASIAKAGVDGELNAQDARGDWQRIEQLAKSQNNQKWGNRALGERSFPSAAKFATEMRYPAMPLKVRLRSRNSL